MSFECPSCEGSPLRPVRLEPSLPALGCGGCGGALLSLLSWREWRESNPEASRAPARSTADGAGDSTEVDDSRSTLRCPKCSGFMTKYRFASDARNQIDLCARCDEVWLDDGEWAQLERFALAGQLAHVFTTPWQNRLRNEDAKRRAEERWREQFGDDYPRARELREWLAAHPKGRELLAYLYLSQTERRD